MPPHVQLGKDRGRFSRVLCWKDYASHLASGTPLDPPGGPGTRCKEEGGPDAPLSLTKWDGTAGNGGWTRDFFSFSL